jgi:hypothetical protein
LRQSKEPTFLISRFQIPKLAISILVFAIFCFSDFLDFLLFRINLASAEPSRLGRDRTVGAPTPFIDNFSGYLHILAQLVQIDRV